MALLRGSAVVASALGEGMEPRNKISLTGFVLAKTPKWSKKPFTIRNVPVTVVNPSPLQVAVRYVFGALARRTRGVPMQAGIEIDGVRLTGKLPPAAEYIRHKKDLISKAVETVAEAHQLPKNREVRIAMNREAYQPTLHTVTDLLAIAEQKGFAKQLTSIIQLQTPEAKRAVGGKVITLSKKTGETTPSA
jgi:hypothetical protein